MKSSTCLSCAEHEELDHCPQKTRIEIEPKLISELTQNISIKFIPSLQDKIRSNPALTAESILRNNFNLSYKDKEGNEHQLKILKSRLVHSTVAENGGSSTLSVAFLQKLRVEKVESINLGVINPWISLPGDSAQNENGLVYTSKDVNEKVVVTERVKTEEEKDIQRAEDYGTAASIGVAFLLLPTLVVKGLGGCAGSSAAYMIRFFNIMDIVSNLGSINVRFGSKIKVAFSFIRSISIPELPLLRTLSPIMDAEPDDDDSSAYQIVTRGSRAKMTQENGQVFLASGENFLFSLLVIIFWGLMTVFECFLDHRSRVLKSVSFMYQTLIGLMFFDFQMISIAEIAFFDYSRIRSFEPKFIFSLVLSVVNLALILSEFLKAILAINKKLRSEKRINEKKSKNRDKMISGSREREDEEEDERSDSPNNEMIMEKYTEVIDTSQGNQRGRWVLILVGDVRFFVIQIIIVSLQHLNRSQSAIVLVINIGYLVYFTRVLLGGKVFKLKIYLIKEIAQEVSIMVLLSTITVFSFTEKSDFNKSKSYTGMELLAIFSIIGACGGEFLILASDLLGSLIESCRRKPQKSKNEILGKEKIFWGNRHEDNVLKHDRETSKAGTVNSTQGLFGKVSVSTKKRENPKRSSQELLEDFEGNLKSRTDFCGENSQYKYFENKKDESEGNTKKSINITIQKKKKNKVSFTHKQKGFRTKTNGQKHQIGGWNFGE